MKTSESPYGLKHIRKAAWKFQKTFRTPLADLQAFVTTIVSVASPESACVTIEQAVFEPKHWIELLTRYSLPTRYGKGVSITAAGVPEIEELLYVVLTDWFDFVFVPTPKLFTIYADHDEYTTFFASTRSNLNRVVTPLLARGFEEIREYTRGL